MAFHPALFVIVWKRLLPQRVVDVSCLFFAAGLCAACMACACGRPTARASTLRPLYLWIPVITSSPSRWRATVTSLGLSLGILALFVLITCPISPHSPPLHANFMVQLTSCPRC